jgi:TRAP-type C4-dicarboxylate transport system substrate-binding protein
VRSLLFVLALTVSARSAPSLRVATIVPEGTPWARELRAWADAVERESKGEVAVQLILGGLAGDDLEVAERIRKGQLDGILSFGALCQKAAPSMRVLKIPGLFQSREEALYVIGQLKPRFDDEARKSGFVNLADGGAGAIIVFSRSPVRTLAELRALKLWVGRQDEFLASALTQLGLKVVPEQMRQVTGDIESGALDGFLAVPAAVLAWQWEKHARYFTDLKVSYLSSCLLVSNASFDSLSLEAQAAVRAAAARLLARSEEFGTQTDRALLGKLFVEHGMRAVTVDERFRSEFLEAARVVRERMAGNLDPRLVPEVLRLLADYRALHK